MPAKSSGLRRMNVELTIFSIELPPPLAGAVVGPTSTICEWANVRLAGH